MKNLEKQDDHLNIDIKKQLTQLQNQLKFLQTTLETKKIIHESSPIQPKLEKTHSQMSKEELIQVIKDTEQGIYDKELSSQIDTELENQQKNLSYDYDSINKTGEIMKIVLTGGPCGGKTTAITTLADKLRERGFGVFIVPEAASLIFQSGGSIQIEGYSDESKIKFQYYLMMMQITLEDIFKGLATVEQQNKDVVLLCDRGTMDGSAYVEKHVWNRIISDHDLQLRKIRDDRYDLIIHMSSAADGVEENYKYHNNQARHESVKFALDLDKKLYEAWMNHHNFVQINNTFKCFQDKIDEVCETVYKFLGLPTNNSYYKKFLVSNPNQNLVDILQKQLPMKINNSHIKDIVFFKDKNSLVYYRKRRSDQLRNYIRCEKTVREGVFQERRRQSNLKEYLSMKKLQASQKVIYRKERDCFIYNRIFLNLDTFKIGDRTFSICFIQGNKSINKQELPELIQKNIIVEIPQQKVNLLSEHLASQAKLEDEFFTEEILDKLNRFSL